MKKLALILAIVGSPAAADGYTGNVLLENCAPESSSFETGVCGGYITGVTAGMHLPPRTDRASDRRLNFPTFTYVCTGNGVTFGQMRDVVIKGLRENPETRNEPASVLVHRYLAEAFPC
ncbi:Rap1a/Tai family immunity protein [Sulfitobacter sp. 915]|uniref:Rap1a/Tai family immunity protein n=1 Tax=Sulfitobacter sp. 915 TaxID=3368558 RepID=UPI0037467F51